jgi:hypothetical protein
MTYHIEKSRTNYQLQKSSSTRECTIENLHLEESALSPESLANLLKSFNCLKSFYYTGGGMSRGDYQFDPPHLIRNLRRFHASSLESLTFNSRAYQDGSVVPLLGDLNCLPNLKVLRTSQEDLLGEPYNMPCEGCLRQPWHSSCDRTKPICTLSPTLPNSPFLLSTAWQLHSIHTTITNQHTNRGNPRLKAPDAPTSQSPANTYPSSPSSPLPNSPPSSHPVSRHCTS